MLEYWNTVYQSKEPWDCIAPSNFLLDVELNQKNIKIADIGCGIGRNSLHFAAKNTSIDCFDISNKALDTLNKKAQSLPGKITTSQMDAADITLSKGTYDLIIFYGVINSIPHSKWPNLTKMMTNALKPEGLIAATAFTDRPYPDQKHDPAIQYLATTGQIKDLFSALKAIKSDARILEHSHHPRGFHVHTIDRYLFKKTKHKVARPKKLAVIGPSNPAYAAATLKTDIKKYEIAARKLAKFIIEHNLEFVGVADRGISKMCLDYILRQAPYSSATIIAPQEQEKGSKNDTPEEWHKALKRKHKDANLTILRDLSWTDQVHDISDISDICVSIGLSCGSLAEIAWTKWTKTPVYASRDLCSKIPDEVTDRIQYHDYTTFDQLLYALKIHLNIQPQKDQI